MVVKPVRRVDEKRLLNRWRSAVQFDQIFTGIPPLYPEDDDEPRDPVVVRNTTPPTHNAVKDLVVSMLELKGEIRYVRTPEGARRFHTPINSPIVGGKPLRHVRMVAWGGKPGARPSTYLGERKPQFDVQGDDGKVYRVDRMGATSWVVHNPSDPGRNVVENAKTPEEALRKLDRYLTPRSHEATPEPTRKTRLRTARKKADKLKAMAKTGISLNADEQWENNPEYNKVATYALEVTNQHPRRLVHYFADEPHVGSWAADGWWSNGYDNCRQIRMAADELVGIPPAPTASDPHLGYVQRATDMTDDQARVNAYLLMDGIAKSENYGQPLYRGMRLEGTAMIPGGSNTPDKADQVRQDFLDAHKPGTKLAEPVWSFADQESVAQYFGGDVMWVLEPPQGVEGGDAGEVVTGGQFEIVRVEQVGKRPSQMSVGAPGFDEWLATAGADGQIRVHIRQVAVYDPEQDGKLVPVKTAEKFKVGQMVGRKRAGGTPTVGAEVLEVGTRTDPVTHATVTTYRVGGIWYGQNELVAMT
jgi:hypothetical protein